ncbi:MAG: serine protease [Treponema sp.]|nr:serine protease [Treponema sp.]
MKDGADFLSVALKAAVAAACAAFVVSCSSIKEPDSVYEEPDYTAEDVRREEIKRIDEMLEKNPVQALWRATLLGDAGTVSKCESAVVDKYNEELEKENYYTAKNLYKSLASVSSKKLSSLSKNYDELDKLCTERVPGLKKINSSLQKVSGYINGTVTIWVDKGLAVKNGLGYADRVIGSGFFISKDGYIITNNHVIADVVDTKSKSYAKLFIKLAEDSDTRIPAKVIGWDPVIDLALLKTEVDAPFIFNLGSSEDLDVGDKIYCIGSPVGLERTLTSGIVSATDRKLFSLGDVMQIDAAVNSGNSGGPCIDSNGNVQAIVFAGMLQYEGLNFAIPVEFLKGELPALYSGGKLNHPWIGCFGHTKRALGKDSGLELQYVLPGGSASRAGMKAGDVIVAVDGQRVKTLEDVQNILIKETAKTIIPVTYRTESDEEKTCAVYLSVRPENPGYTVYSSDIIANSFVPIFGMKLIHASTSSRNKYTISSLIRGSIADESGFSENDSIEIRKVSFDNDNSVLYAEVYTKNRKKGYLDVVMAIGAKLDSPYYF